MTSFLVGESGEPKLTSNNPFKVYFFVKITQSKETYAVKNGRIKYIIIIIKTIIIIKKYENKIM